MGSRVEPELPSRFHRSHFLLNEYAPEMAGTLLFYDFETDGADPQFSRPYQFACVRTDMDLNPIPGPEGKGIEFLCRPSDDHLPAPEAVLITGITPQQAAAKGLHEAEFFGRIHALCNTPGTISVGWNSLRFDDLLCRWGFWRNFLEPYGHTYAMGCRAWDLIDLTRAAWAMRPEGLMWPLRDDQSPSFRLDQLAPANGIDHGDAHDALADVHATVAFARLLKDAQPKLWNYGLSLCETDQVESLLEPGAMIVHSTTRIPNRVGCTTLMHVIGKTGPKSRDFIGWDLRKDPSELLEADAETIARRTFSSQETLGDETRFALKKIKSNRAPFVLEASDAVLESFDTDRLELDLADIARHHQLLDNPTVAAHLRTQIQQVWQFEGMSADDADDALYDGFLRGHDKALIKTIPAMPPDQLVSLESQFEDRRLPGLLLHYRARNFPETLDHHATERWAERCRTRLTAPRGRHELGWPIWRTHVQEMIANAADDLTQLEQLTQVLDWGDEIAERINLPMPTTAG